MFVWPTGWMPAIWPCRSSTPPSGWVRTTQWALLVERHDPEFVARGHRRGGPQDRLLADVHLAHAADPGPPPAPPSNVLQWQASIEPDWSMTTTSATSGCFSRSRTPMSTGSDSSSGVFW